MNGKRWREVSRQVGVRSDDDEVDDEEFDEESSEEDDESPLKTDASEGTSKRFRKPNRGVSSVEAAMICRKEDLQESINDQLQWSSTSMGQEG